MFQKVKLGFFQRFIFPSNGKNYYLKITYNPHSLYVAKVANNNIMLSSDHNENSNDFLKKLYTIEGAANMNVSYEPVTYSRLLTKIAIACEEIQKKISNLYLKSHDNKTQTKDIIKNLSIIMKLDNHSKLFLIAVTELEFILDTKWSNDKKVFISNFETSNIGTNLNKELKLVFNNKGKDTTLDLILLKRKAAAKNMILCKGCSRLVNKELLYEISYKMLISNHEYKSRMNGSNSYIPDIIKKIKSMKLTNEAYDKLRSFNAWLDNTEKLCNECFLDNTEYIQQFTEYTRDKVVKLPQLFDKEKDASLNLIYIKDNKKSTLFDLEDKQNREDEKEYKFIERMIAEKTGVINYDTSNEFKFTLLNEGHKSSQNDIQSISNYYDSPKIKNYFRKSINSNISDLRRNTSDNEQGVDFYKTFDLKGITETADTDVFVTSSARNYNKEYFLTETDKTKERTKISLKKVPTVNKFNNNKITGGIQTLNQINDYLYKNTKFYYKPVKTLKSKEQSVLDRIEKFIKQK